MPLESGHDIGVSVAITQAVEVGLSFEASEVRVAAPVPWADDRLSSVNRLSSGDRLLCDDRLPGGDGLPNGDRLSSGDNTPKGGGVLGKVVGYGIMEEGSGLSLAAAEASWAKVACEELWNTLREATEDRRFEVYMRPLEAVGLS